MELPELDTRNILNVVEENFERIGLKTYAVRMIYIGEHALPKQDILAHFKQSVAEVNSSYCEINVNGLLLVYDSYFVHILEGSEDTIHRQLRFLFKREENYKEEMARLDEERHDDNSLTPRPERVMFRRLKMLMVYHSISTLLFDNWRAVTARPPSLIGKLDAYGPLAEHMEQLRVCLDKITKLCDFAKSEPNLQLEGLNATDPKMLALPEVALIDFLLQSPHVMDLRQIVYMHRRVDDYYFYFEHVWPLPSHFTPRYLYKLKIDDSFVEPLPVMPWELKKEEEKEGEELEEKQSSSDSD